MNHAENYSTVDINNFICEYTKLGVDLDWVDFVLIDSILSIEIFSVTKRVFPFTSAIDINNQDYKSFNLLKKSVIAQIFSYIKWTIIPILAGLSYITSSYYYFFDIFCDIYTASHHFY